MTRKIMVIGSSCSGKTTLAARLAELLDVPHVELDAHHHLPGWREATAADLRASVERALEGLEGWVVDGNYMGKLGLWLVDQADTVVWIDLPLGTLLRRMVPRTYRRIRSREELWNEGNYERWRTFLFARDGLLWFTLRNHGRRRREYPERLAGRPLVRLSTPAEVERWFRAQRP